MTTVFPTTSRGVPATTTHYRTTSYIPQQSHRPGPNVTDDYERKPPTFLYVQKFLTTTDVGWYTEASPSNRMLLSLRSGIDTEIGWALDRLCRLCDNEQFLLRAIPGLTDALFEWPEWYASEPDDNESEAPSLFAPPLDTERKQRHALESLFILRNAALNEPNALELANHPRTQPLIIKALRNRKANSDRNTEFLVHTLELLQAVAAKATTTQLPEHVNVILSLQRIAGQSSDRSLIITSLTALTQVLSNTNTSCLEPDSPAFLASIKYLPLFVDKPLVDACLNYLYVHLSHPTLAKAFLHHSDMPGTLKLFVSLLLAEQVEEMILQDIGNVVHTVPALAVATRDHDLTKEELDDLLEKPEPQRCYEWYFFFVL
jgi:chromatin structure-remodeling complex subunit RSC9